MTATALDLFAPRQQAAPEPTDADERDVLRTLKQFADNGKRWVLGRELVESIGWPDCENSRRKLRAVAEANAKRILSGDKGYALLSNCTPDEIIHAANRLRTQAEKMLRRSLDIQNAYHTYGRVAQ